MYNSIFKILLSNIAIVLFLTACFQKSKNSNNQSDIRASKEELKTLEYDLKRGNKIAITTQGLLGKKLISAINSKGTHKALDFCNIEAIPLTDSMSMELNAKIKRVSDKNRNPNNAANEQELAYISNTKLEIIQNGKIKPKIFEKNNKVIGYYPIMTNALCLQCHGNLQTDVDQKTQNAIRKNYPKDLAIGYSVNELRGIWVIEMEKN